MEVTDDQLKAMWVQTQILSRAEKRKILDAKKKLASMEEWSATLSAELIRRGFVIKSNFQC